MNAFWPFSCIVRSLTRVKEQRRVETCLATRQINEDVISKNNRDIGFGRGFSLIHGPSLLCVNCPSSCLPVFGDLELENAVGLDSDHDQGPSGNEEF